ncbi:MAG TPA: YigZ family protein [Candidatus Mediterraneibacter ornithocaccae]|jgi:uncharacterized YigZ family protein|uniref:YigZ family protein n=1 Tax=Mediterraneibacter glycyrrhizinilyticus TaxID=342942 RepID=UPI000B3A4E97|nr:YigZ family protein [Mediterraneibacter glycyrrhizinilyticus]MDN0044375.1 YigZ family protein [Mediterraneibacter glycyrrhizinilyticus]OUO28941.1 YigZ family protein [Lachnoclostridium sp. An298]HJA20874.1 YigZ family protein [Candidatus Mediterraneibacter ornithocaccae]
MDRYDTVYRGGTGEYIEKRSRFIGQVYPVSSEEEVFAYLEEIKKKYWDARHHCWAYVIGRNPASERMSDDGEPAGTAGKPILEVIRGKGITNVLVVVTRYFGGTLLGTGGLVRSYTAASAEALSHSVIITRIFGFRVDIHSDYAGLGRIQYLIAQRGLYVQDTVYTDRVVISVLVPEEEERAFSKEVQEGTNGQAVMEKKGDCWFAQTENGIQIWNE